MSKSEYDRGVNTFSPEGRLFQVEYALEAIKLGTTAIGIVTKEGVILAAEKRMMNPLVISSSIQKLNKLSDSVGACMSGLTADARLLVDHVRVEALQHKFVYNEEMPVGSVVDTLAELFLDFATPVDREGKNRKGRKRIMTRPFGVSMLVCGSDSEKSKLYCVDPSGTVVSYKACAIGAATEGATQILNESWTPEMNFEKGMELCLVILRQVMEEKLIPSNLEIGFSDNSTGKFEVCTAENVQSAIDKLPPPLEAA